MRVCFVRTSLYDRQADRLFHRSEEIQRVIENEILPDPFAGDIVAGTGGVRKIRVALPGRGKRGSLRVIYFYRVNAAVVYLLGVYPKTAKEDLTAEDSRRLRQIISSIEEELR